MTIATLLPLAVGDSDRRWQAQLPAGRVLEAYYALDVTKEISLTFDYRLLTNPAYNADQGPISIFSGRLRGF
jgi:hypothetical protein